MMARPNILFITSDQQRGDCYGFEGRRVKTPHLDQLARDGTRFSTCITPNVVCQPARSSMLTGLLPRTHGVRDNGIDLDATVGAAGFAGQFVRAGYKSGFIGKGHFSTYYTFKPTGRPECLYNTQDYDENWYGPYMGFDHVELAIEGHNYYPPQKPPKGQHYERWFYADGMCDQKDRLLQTHLPPDVQAVQTWNSALPVAWHNSTWIGNRSIRFLQENHGEPFILWASFPDPHAPFDAPEPWSRLHHPEEIDLPRHGALDLDRRPWWHKASLERTPQIADSRLRSMREDLDRPPVQTEEQMRNLIANYYGMIALIDHNVGRILIELDTLGLSNNTYVVYSSDHGEWLGDHGLILKGPMLYEGLLRVGCLVRGPNVPAGHIVGDPVSTVDLPATFYDWAGIPAAGQMHSRSLRGLIEGSSATRDFAYNEWDVFPSRCGVALELRTVRTRTHKLTLELKSGAGELYHLSDDPDEMDNRFDDPGQTKVQKELVDMIRSRPDDVMQPLPEPVGIA